MCDNQFEHALNRVNTFSRPSDLRITDVEFCDIKGAPMHCILLKIKTNQGLEGYGEIRDGSDRLFGQMLVSRLIGQNPCDIDKIFRRIKQFGGHARQAGGVCGVEVALWDLAGKAYGMPVYQMLGGKFRDTVRVYCDTDNDGSADGHAMGERILERLALGFTFVKMDLGINLLNGTPNTLNAPLGLLDSMHKASREGWSTRGAMDAESIRKRILGYDAYNVMHPFTGIQITEKGLDIMEKYVHDVREVIGYEVPLALDHFGHIGIDSCIRLGRRLEAYNIAWLEDMVPWQFPELFRRLNQEVNIPICTGEDIYLKENFKPLLENGGVSVIHPDVLSSGGILENKKIGDMAQDYGVAMAVHMAESPIACLAAAHSVASTENFLALEFHSVDVPWWGDMAKTNYSSIIDHGFITLNDDPGLGIQSLNDEVLEQHKSQRYGTLWEDSKLWQSTDCWDRLWS